MKAMIVGSPAGAEGLAERLSPLFARLGELLERRDCTLSVMLTDDEGMRGYNRRFRDRDETTDVLAFASLAGSEAEAGHYLGDLVVSVERATEQGEERGHSLAEEVEVLVLHGVLHLLGHDHETDGGAMRDLEARLARELFGSLRGLIDREEDDPE